MITQSMLYSFKRIASYCIALVVLVSCSKDEAPVKQESLNVSFSVITQDVLVGESIVFNNTTTGTINEIVWDFGDGTTSTLQNPSHTYSELGDYIVNLTVKNDTQEKTSSKEFVVSLSNDISGRSTLKEKLNGIMLNNKILVCAHRATELDTPENSLAGIQKAINNDIGMIEIDVRQTKDGELVLMHDATIDRTTNGTGNVSNYTLQEIQQFNLYKENGTLTNEKIPTLNQVFEKARGKIYINLDINDKAPFNRVYALVKQYGMLKQVQFYTKDNNLIRSMLNTNQDLVVLPYIDNVSEFNAYTSTNLSIVHYSDNSFNETLIQEAKNKGWAVYANVYVNTSTTPQSDSNRLIDKFILLEGRVLQTDYPEYIKNYLQQKNLN
ncbi:glycerophosphodiester phosphodiesterase family protein [Gaetbulibacter aquiaggeris]|uniref:Glycerophosphodiester phosphodiesterase family protein n=1 Tax=Gaetbulibacter aquiaggeris TaxID=1735373 RepID=A0ABW7MUK6_9FLAO